MAETGQPIYGHSLTIRPRLWAAWTWLALIITLTALILSILFSRGDPVFPLQASFLGLLAAVSAIAVTRFSRPWTLEVDAQGIRRLIGGRVRDSIPWDRVAAIRYGIRPRVVIGGARGGTQYSAARFLNVRDRRALHSIYVDTVYYSIAPRSLAAFTEHLAALAEARGIEASYEQTAWLPPPT